jgi:hypothetical protein
MAPNKYSIPNKVHHKEPPLERKKALQKMGEFGKIMIASALPAALIGISPNKATAQFEDLEMGRALNFILLIEFMQTVFYDRARNKDNLFPPEYREIFLKIGRQHRNRIQAISNNIGRLGLNTTPLPEFDFEADGRFNPFGDFDEFLNLAQIIEDTTSGVYKSQSEIIFQNRASAELKRKMLRLHSTNNRYAYYIRFLRSQRGLDDIKGWINQATLGTLSPDFENIYADENRIIQDEVDIASNTDASTQAIQEAWDEPVSRGMANGVLRLFTRPI